MTQELKDKLAKIYALVQHGGTEGEKAAAKHQLDKMLKKYNLEGLDLDSIEKSTRYFTFTSELERSLFGQLVKKFCPEEEIYRKVVGGKKTKTLVLDLNHLNFIELSSSYEYFRRHMNLQWKKTALPVISRKRTVKTKNKSREQLQVAFLGKYLYLSGLWEPKDDSLVDPRDLTREEAEAYLAVRNIEGGKYSKQVQTAHQLPPTPNYKVGQLSIF